MAQYPGSVASFTTKVNGQTVDEKHINDMQDEIVAITSALLNGLAHVLQPGTDAARDLGSLTKRWRDFFLSRDATVGGNLSVAGDLAVTGNATFSGTVTAATFTGDGSGLTGVVAVDNSAIPTGAIVPMGRATAPDANWLLCDGAAVDRTTYAALFAAIGTSYGAGDGSTTFNIPDLRGRFPLGKAASGTGATLGETGGSLDHTHTTSPHTHGVGTLAVASHSHGVGTLAVASHSHSAGTLATSSAGSHSHTVDSHTHGAGSYAAASHSHSITFTIAGADSGGSSVVTSITSPTGSASPAVTGTSGPASPGTSSNGSHTHTISGSTASTAPSISGNTGSTAPAVSGSTALGGGDPTGANNPPYLTLNYFIKV